MAGSPLAFAARIAKWGALWRCTTSKKRAGLPFLPPPDEGHFRGHDGHEQDIGIEWEVGHVQDGLRHMVDVHHGLDRHLPVSLKGALGHARRVVGERIADIDLPTGDIVLASIERGGLGEPRDGVLRGGVRG